MSNFPHYFSSLAVWVMILGVEGTFYYDGHQELGVNGTIAGMCLSSDGSRLALIKAANHTVEIYENNQQTFVLLQYFSLGVMIRGIKFSPTNTYFIAFTSNTRIYKSAQGYYSSLQTLSKVANDAAFSQDESKIFLAETNGNFSIYQTNGASFYQTQEILASANSILQIAVSGNEQFLVMRDSTHLVMVYQWSSTMYTFKTDLSFGLVSLVAVTDNQLIVVDEEYLRWHHLHAGNFTNTNNYQILSSNHTVYHAKLGRNNSILYLTTSQGVKIVEKSAGNVSTTVMLGSSAYKVDTDASAHYFLTLFLNSTITVDWVCPSTCYGCYFPNNCMIDESTDTNESGNVSSVRESSLCVQNIYITDDICEEYCSEKCETCNQTQNDCLTCSSLYEKNAEGQCVLKYASLSAAAKARFLMNFLRRGSLKFAFFVIDDLWLYSYHKKNYEGVVKDTLEIIQYLEEKQWNAIQMDEVRSQIENEVEFGEYNGYSNEKFMKEERKNNVFLTNTWDFFVFFLPMTLLFVLVSNLLFRLLFNYQISILLRPYSFKAIIFQLTVQNNIQFFTFLGFRALTIPFSFDHGSKWLLILAVIMFFLSTFSAFSSYAIYYSSYKKLARYFLANMYRFPTSYALMIILYGVRPFLKGSVHALFYENYVLQLGLLIGIEVLMIIITIAFQIFFDNHKSLVVLVLQLLYNCCLVALNALLILKFHVYEDQVDKEMMEKGLEIIIYTMMGLISFKVFFQVVIQNLPFEAIRKLCCPKRTSSVSPQEKQSKKSRSSIEVKPYSDSKEGSQKMDATIINFYQNKGEQAAQKFDKDKILPKKKKQKRGKKLNKEIRTQKMIEDQTELQKKYSPKQNKVAHKTMIRML